MILRPCRWCIAPFASLQAAPKDGKAATEWPNIHSAFDDVASRIERVVIDLRRAVEAQRKADVERRRAEEEARRAEEREDKRRAEGKAPATVDEVVAPHKQPESGPQPERSNPDRFSIPRTCPRCGGTGKVDYSSSVATGWGPIIGRESVPAVEGRVHKVVGGRLRPELFAPQLLRQCPFCFAGSNKHWAWLGGAR